MSGIIAIICVVFCVGVAVKMGRDAMDEDN